MSHSFFRLPMFGFTCLGFLMIGVILAVACWLAFRSGEPGKGKLGGFAGCMVALALLLIAGVGALGCTAVAFLGARSEMVRRGPVKSFQLEWNDRDKGAREGGEKGAGEPRAEDESHALHLRVEMRGGDASEVTRWFKENTEGDLTISIATVEDPDGPLTRIDFGLPVTNEELAEIRRNFERDMPNLRLPKGIKVELKGEND
jgi:hypothetical protein